jgi:hypothetical protein
MRRATPTGVSDPHVVVDFPAVTGPAYLNFDTGLERFTVMADADTPALLDARLGAPLPVVWATHQQIHIRYRLGSRLRRRPDPSRVRLSARVPWTLEVHGGAAHLDADLRGLDIQALTFHAALAAATLTLPAPRGEVPVRMGTAQSVRITRPARVPMRVEVGGGATRVCLDGRRRPAAGYGLTAETPGPATATDRYLVLVTGSADDLHLTVE